jgi:predicted Zn-dependent protease
VSTPPSSKLPATGWATHLCQELARSLASASEGRLRLLRAVVHQGTYSWLLSTAEGFVACCDGTTGSLLTEVTPCQEDYGTWREWVRIDEPESFEPQRIARQISDRALLTTLPVTSVSGVRDVILHGEVTAHLIAGLLPVFCASSPAHDPVPGLLSSSGELAAPGLTLVDDRLDPRAPVTGPCDGEGLPAQRTLLVEDGIPRHRLASYRDALLFGETPRGSALRISYRDYPATGPANLRLTTDQATSPANLLQAVDRALYCLRPVAPIELDLANDTYRLLSSAVWLEHGRVVGWQPIVELHGGIGVMLRRIDGIGSDLCWYQTDRGFVGASTLLVRRQAVGG